MHLPADNEKMNPKDIALPEILGRDHLVVLLCDPYTVFLFWELQIAAQDSRILYLNLNALEKDFPNELIPLENSPKYKQKGSFYLHVPPGKLFQVEIGFLENGQFAPELISATFRMPYVDGGVTYQTSTTTKSNQSHQFSFYSGV